MPPRFQFLEFQPDDALRKEADRALERLLGASPYGSHAAALLAKTADGYRCAIEVYTSRGPFIASSHQTMAASALEHVRRALETKLVQKIDAPGPAA